MSNSDLLYDCAKSYQDLMSFEYKIKLIHSSKIFEFKLSFKNSDFKHLTGIEKLNIPRYDAMSRSYLYNAILARKIKYTDLINYPQINIPFKQNAQLGIDYFFSDRLKELECLKEYLSNADKFGIHIYHWKKDVHQTERPFNSKISADLLIEFSNGKNKKFPNQLTCAFFAENDNNILTGVSIFPSDMSYHTDDDKRKDAFEYEILSIEEVNINTNSIRQVISVSPQKLQTAIDAALKKEQSITIKNDLKSLAKKRFKNGELPSNIYLKKRSIFANKNIYTLEMLDEVKGRLEAQKDDPHNKDFTKAIEDEIKFIQEEKVARLELSPTPNFSSASISSDGTITSSKIDISEITTETLGAIERKTHLLSGSIATKLDDIRDFFKKTINFLKKSNRTIKIQKETAATKEKSPRSSAKPATEKKNVSHNENTFSAAPPQRSEQRPQQRQAEQSVKPVQKAAEPKTVHSGYTIMNRAQRAAKTIEARKKAEAVQQLGDNKSAPKKNNQSR